MKISNISNVFFAQQFKFIASKSILPTNQILYTRKIQRNFDIDYENSFKTNQ